LPFEYSSDTAYQFEGAKGMFNRINGVLLDGDPDKKSTEDRLDSHHGNLFQFSLLTSFSLPEY
jgi:hypothetical protein